MTVDDLAKPRMAERKDELLSDMAYQMILSSCANPEYVAMCLEEMRLTSPSWQLTDELRPN